MNYKNHHGFIVTSPRGSVSLKDLPVPVHESKEKAAAWGRAQGKPFVITTAATFYRTSFGKVVRTLTHKKLSRRTIPGDLIGEEQGTTYTLVEPSPLTALLNRIRQKKAEKAFHVKVADDTRKRYAKADVLAKQLNETGRELDAERAKMSDKSYLLQAMQPPEDRSVHRASNDDLMSLFLKQDTAMQQMIDVATRFRWDKKRVNKLVKSGTVQSLLVLFRAGQLPERCRTNRNLLREINK